MLRLAVIEIRRAMSNRSAKIPKIIRSIQKTAFRLAVIQRYWDWYTNFFYANNPLLWEVIHPLKRDQMENWSSWADVKFSKFLCESIFSHHLFFLFSFDLNAGFFPLCMLFSCVVRTRNAKNHHQSCMPPFIWRQRKYSKREHVQNVNII